MTDPTLDRPPGTPLDQAPGHVPACYREQEIREYRGNPLIEALPPILSRPEAAAALGQFPDYRPEDRALPDHLRLHALWQLLGLVQPLSEHLDLAARISRMIRDGYVRRNPVTPEFFRRALGVDAALRGDAPTPAAGGPARVKASSMTLLGISGVGKTTALERVFALYPQVVVHREYAGRPLARTQLVWLKLECPSDGSIRGLCVNFFEQVDAVLGTQYATLLITNRDSAETLLPKMARVAYEHLIGVLAVDEIQHLSEAKSGGERRMLNFFVTLVNKIGLPVLLVGTYKASGILAGEFRQARRGCGQGDFVWDPMAPDGPKASDWRLFVEAVTEHQHTRQDTPVTKELIDTLFAETQGITALVVLLWTLAQERAIETGGEVVTPAIIRSVAQDRFRLLRPLLQALRAKDTAALHRLGDVLPILPRPRVLPGVDSTHAGVAPTPPDPASEAGRPVLDGGIGAATDPHHIQPAPSDAGAGPTIGRSLPGRASGHARSRARSRVRAIRGPAGSLPRLVAEALAADGSAHDALRTHGLLCDLAAGVVAGPPPVPGGGAERAA